jgi:DNA-binding transcriptional ArsR family regulator
LLVAASDVTAIRALAHPLRLRLLDLLRIDGPSTSTILAQRTGESTGSTSYHLRQLARHGFIAEAEREASGRERWWRYVERQALLEAEDGDASRQLVRELLVLEGDALDRFLAEPERPPDWDRAAFVQSRVVSLTPKELERLSAEIAEVCRPLRDTASSEVPTDARPVRILALAFPTAA